MCKRYVFGCTVSFALVKTMKNFTTFFQAQNQFSSPLEDQTAKEGKDKKVEFVAKFTKQNAKPKWYFRKDVRALNDLKNHISIDRV